MHFLMRTLHSMPVIDTHYAASTLFCKNRVLRA
jgi:hypothetical protein